MDFKREISKEIEKYTCLDSQQIYNMIEVPADSALGDYAFPCFRLAKQMRKPPAAIAAEIREKIGENYLFKVENVAAYLNFTVNKEIYAKTVLESVGKCYGKIESLGKTIVIDFSSPNIAKPFHIGHLGTTVIGNAIRNILKFQGYNVISVNHLGDWGTQFGRLITAYKKWGSRQVIDEKGIDELTRLYVKFYDEAEKEPDLNNQARNWLLKMQQGDTEALEIWKWFCQISLREFEKSYKRLNITFDYFTGESFYNDKMEVIVAELKEKGLLTLSDGASVVDLTEYNMPPCLILRSDGGTLYPTRDIAAAKYRHDTFEFEKALYVTGLEQRLHFAQWFKVLELMGYDWAKGLTHVPYGMVSLETGKMSTRAGNVIHMEDILDEAVAKTAAIIEEKNPGLANKDQVAEMVGIGAVIFQSLYNQRIKDVSFSWERMLNFEGETCPYVQYTYARAGGIIEKAGDMDFPENYTTISDDASMEVVRLIYAYPEKISEAAKRFEPYILTRHLVDLAQAFNRFYQLNNIQFAEKEEKQARLAVVRAVRIVIKEGLSLLGISTPEKM